MLLYNVAKWSLRQAANGRGWDLQRTTRVHNAEPRLQVAGQHPLETGDVGH